MGFLPLSTSSAVFDRRYSTIFIEPRSVEDKDLAIEQFRQVDEGADSVGMPTHGIGDDDRVLCLHQPFRRLLHGVGAGG